MLHCIAMMNQKCIVLYILYFHVYEIGVYSASKVQAHRCKVLSPFMLNGMAPKA